MKARDNPFSTDRVLRVRYDLRDTTPEALLQRLADLGNRVALVGPEGSGKSTLLEDMAPWLEARGYSIVALRLDREQRTFPRGYLAQLFRDLTPRDFILFDGAEQMNRLAWERFKRGTRGAAGLVVTAHRPGLLPTLREHATSPELLRYVVGELVDLQETTAWGEMLDDLYARHHGNLRDVLRELYDIAAASP